MATNIPENDLRFSQLAVKQGWIQPEQARTAMELYLRYQSKGGEAPSIGRILVNKGFLGRKQGEQLLRHILKGEPLPPADPSTASSAPSTVAIEPPPPPPRRGKTGSVPVPVTRTAGVVPGAIPQIIPAPQAHDQIIPAPSVPAFLDPTIPGAQLPPQPKQPPKKPIKDTDTAMLRGMGALVLSQELLDLKGYKIDSVVGEGSMGIVYKAIQVSMEREVALKVLPPDRTKDQKFVEEFLAEARNAGRLNHPNLIRVHEVGRNGSLFYYSMEFIDGYRLDELMDEREGGRLDPKQAITIFIQVASALDYGQKAGIVHREVRPNAVMITPDGHAKLADLGMVKDEASRFLIGENAYYVSPEQAQGEEADTRSDIYSLGCCTYHALTGERPFEGGPPKVVLAKRLHEPTPNPRNEIPELSKEIARVVMTMMARDPNQRYQTPGQVVEELKKINMFVPVLTPARNKGPLQRKRFRR